MYTIILDKMNPPFYVYLLESTRGTTYVGATVNLNNNVSLPRAASTLFFDGRDRIGCTAAIAVTRAGWGIAPGTVLASATEVYDTRRFGTSYKIPIGITTGSVQNFEYSSLHIIASQDNTSVQVDVDGNGSVNEC